MEGLRSGQGTRMVALRPSSGRDDSPAPHDATLVLSAVYWRKLLKPDPSGSKRSNRAQAGPPASSHTRHIPVRLYGKDHRELDQINPRRSGSAIRGRLTQERRQSGIRDFEHQNTNLLVIRGYPGQPHDRMASSTVSSRLRLSHSLSQTNCGTRRKII